MSLHFIISGNPVSSKNSIRSGITKQGRNYTYTKKEVKDYRDNALKQLNEQIISMPIPITEFVRASFIFYCIDNRKRDLVNLIQCPADLLQQAGIVSNDYLIRSLDGSYIADIDKDNPRTEIFITLLKE